MRQRDHSLFSDLASVTGTSCLSTLPRLLAEAALLSCFIRETRTPSPTRGSRSSYAVGNLHRGIFRIRENLKGLGATGSRIHGMKSIPPLCFNFDKNLYPEFAKSTKPLELNQTKLQ